MRPDAPDPAHSAVPQRGGHTLALLAAAAKAALIGIALACAPEAEAAGSQARAGTARPAAQLARPVPRPQASAARSAVRPPARNAVRQATRSAARAPSRSASRPAPRASAASRPAATRRQPAARTATRSRRPTPRPAIAASPGNPRPAVLRALVSTARFEGLEPALMLAIAAQESSLDPDARNSVSTATGLMQFTRDTWLEAVRDHGRAHGLTRHAAALTTDRDGTIAAPSDRHRDIILALRRNPGLSVALAAERLQRAQRDLREPLGREPAPEDLYLIHLLGMTGGRRFLLALAEQPALSSASIAAAAVSANPGLFKDGTRVLTLAQVHARVRERLAAQLTQHAALLAAILVAIETDARQRNAG